MRVLLINDTLIGGGKERRIVQLVCSLMKVPGMEVHIALLDRKGTHAWKGEVGDMKDLVDYPEIWQSGATVHFIERRWKKDPRGFPALYKLVRKIRPDLINVWSVMGAFYTIPIASLLGIPLVSSFVADCNGAPKGGIWWWIIQAAIWKSRFVTGNSKAGLDAYAIPNRKAVAIYNGFNFGRLDNLASSEEVKAGLGIQTRYLVAMAARFDSFKDFDTYLSAANRVLDQRKDVTFLCLGQGSDLERCRSLVNSNHGDRVLFAGFRKDAESVFAACDLTVLCSNDAVHKEGISNSILESMAAGTPVIATDAGGSPEIVEHAHSGFLVPSADPGLLAEKILEILGSESLRVSMGKRSREIVEQRFSIDSMREGFLSVYEKAMGR